MTFRSATDADRALIEGLIFPILRDYGLEPSPESTDADLADIQKEYPEGIGTFELLVDADGSLAGTVAIHRTTEDLCELRKMYLAPEYRGRGLGRRLLEHGIKRAREMGYRQIWLETAHSLIEAQHLYEKAGFEAFDAPHKSSRCDFALARDL